MGRQPFKIVSRSPLLALKLWLASRMVRIAHALAAAERGRRPATLVSAGRQGLARGLLRTARRLTRLRVTSG